MYTLKVSHGYLVDEFDDERETETVEILGTYEDEEEALKAAENKFGEVLKYIDDIEIRFGEVKDSPYRYYVTYGPIDEYGTVVYGYNHYYKVSVKSRRLHRRQRQVRRAQMRHKEEYKDKE